MTELEPLLRELFPQIQKRCECLAGLSLEDVTSLDHLYTDGLACGSSFKVLYSWPSQTHMQQTGQLYIFPDGSCISAVASPISQSIQKELTQQLIWLQETFGEAASRIRQLKRTAHFKEELMAVAWRPARIAAALEAGKEVEDL